VGKLTGGTIGNIYKDKTGVTLNFKYITKEDVANNYIYVNDEIDSVEFGFDYSTLVGDLNSEYVRQSNEKSVVIEPTATGEDIVDGIVGNEERLKGLLAGDGVTIQTIGKDIVFTVDQTWLDTQISNSLGMAEQGNAKSYLFSAKALGGQIIKGGNSIQDVIRFEDDESTGMYDYDNTWTTSRWVANADAGTDGDVEFHASIVVETLTGTTGGNIVFSLVHEAAAAGSTPTIMLSDIISISSTAVGDVFSGFISVRAGGTPGITIQQGDKVYLWVNTNTTAVGQDVKIQSANIHNVEV
jgi:hypothetical protein